MPKLPAPKKKLAPELPELLKSIEKPLRDKQNELKGQATQARQQAKDAENEAKADRLWAVAKDSIQKTRERTAMGYDQLTTIMLGLLATSLTIAKALNATSLRTMLGNPSFDHLPLLLQGILSLPELAKNSLKDLFANASASDNPLILPNLKYFVTVKDNKLQFEHLKRSDGVDVTPEQQTLFEEGVTKGFSDFNFVKDTSAPGRYTITPTVPGSTLTQAQLDSQLDKLNDLFGLAFQKVAPEPKATPAAPRPS